MSFGDEFGSRSNLSMLRSSAAVRLSDTFPPCQERRSVVGLGLSERLIGRDCVCSGIGLESRDNTFGIAKFSSSLKPELKRMKRCIIYSILYSIKYYVI